MSAEGPVREVATVDDTRHGSRGKDAGSADMRNIEVTEDAASRRVTPVRRPGSFPGQAPNPFSYAVLRLVPQVERGERINAGVVLFCRPLQYLGREDARWTRRGCARALARARPETVRPHLAADRAHRRRRSGGRPIAQLDTTARFHWLVAPSSTIIQPSEVHTGICGDPAEELEKLFRELVAP